MKNNYIFAICVKNGYKVRMIDVYNLRQNSLFNYKMEMIYFDMQKNKKDCKSVGLQSFAFG